MPENSVQTCITSPPYWGLRDYGHDGQVGLEQTPDEYVAKMVEVFREVRRVLRDDGTLWVNLGDSYASGGGQAYPLRDSCGGLGKKGTRGTQPYHSAGGGFERPASIAGAIKPKDLVGIPWRVALALQADGWWLRQDIIWNKPNPMPESVQDRCTKSHEYIFLFAKSNRYYFDAKAIAEPSVTNDTRKPYGSDGAWAMDGRDKWEEGKGKQRDNADGAVRNRRSVWTVTTKSYRGAHFATFPEALVEPMVLAGSSEKGCCEMCGSPWERQTRRVGQSASVAGPKSTAKRDQGLATAFSGYADGSTAPVFRTIGFQMTCKCDGAPIPCTVLDPFTGSGTTGAVALRLGRNFVGCELNPEYVNLAESRLRGEAPPVLESEESENPEESVFDLFGES